jgi:hypothetical protein
MPAIPGPFKLAILHIFCGGIIAAACAAAAPPRIEERGFIGIPSSTGVCFTAGLKLRVCAFLANPESPNSVLMALAPDEC